MACVLGYFSSFVVFQLGPDCTHTCSSLFFYYSAVSEKNSVSLKPLKTCLGVSFPFCFNHSISSWSFNVFVLKDFLNTHDIRYFELAMETNIES